MFVIECSIFYLAVRVMMGGVSGLVELPQVEDNDIKNVELIIRTTTNTLFSTLKLQSKKARPRLQYFTLVHHYLTSLTLEDSTALREIAKLTRVDMKAINNRTLNFITALTEVLDYESNNLYTENVTKVDGIDEADRFIEEYMKELEHKIYYSNHSYDREIEIVKLLLIQDSTGNATNTIQGTLDIWKPSPLDLLRSGRRIFKGKYAKIEYFPFMASVHIFDQFMCGGCIIKSDLIITAASCLQLAYNNRLFRENPAFLSVRVGSTFFQGTGERIDVIAVYFHPSYNPSTLHNNLAIMRLHRMMNFKSSRIKKIQIDRKAIPLSEVTERILVLGWGARSENNRIENSAVNRLATALLDFYPLQECREVYSKKYVTHQHFCAGFFSKGSGACNRDVGGPGVVEGTLMGIISFGSPSCGSLDAPTVFTKVGYYSEWIDEIMDLDVPRVKGRTTKIPRTIGWDKIYSDHINLNPEYDINLSPVMKGVSPRPVVTMDPKKTTKKWGQILRDEDFTSRKPSDSSEQIQSVVKIPSEANITFTVTTYATPLANLEVSLFTEMSENLFTPELSDEYSSTENISQINTGTNDINSKIEEDILLDEVSSMNEKLEIAEESYPKDKLYSQTTVLKDIPSQDQTPSYDQKLQKLEIAEETYPNDKFNTQMTVVKGRPSQDHTPLYDQKPLHYKSPLKGKKPLQDEKTLQHKKPLQYEKPLHEKKPIMLEFTLPEDILSEETSEKMSRPKASASQTSRPQMPTAVMSPPESSPSKILTTKKLPSEIKLPKTKDATEEDSADKYSSNEKSTYVDDDVLESGSESDLLAIPIEIESTPKTAIPAVQMLRFAHSTIYPALPKNTFGIMSNDSFTTEESFLDSEIVDSELSLAPSPTKTIKKKNQAEIDKTILTLLYLSDIEKNNDFDGLIEDKKLAQTNSDSELTSGEDVSINTKLKNSILAAKSKKFKKKSKKLSNDFSTNILFDILKEAIQNGIFTDKLKRISKYKQRSVKLAS